MRFKFCLAFDWAHVFGLGKFVENKHILDRTFIVVGAISFNNGMVGDFLPVDVEDDTGIILEQFDHFFLFLLGVLEKNCHLLILSINNPTIPNMNSST